MVDALRRASAGRITAVMPYYGYARQDKKNAPREPITGRLVADLLQSAGVHRILALDLEADQIEGFFNIPVDHLRALPLFAEYLREKVPEPAVVVAPDDGAVKVAYRLAERLRLPLAVVFQRRTAPDTEQTVQVVGEVEGRIPVLIDRIISTGGTIASAFEQQRRCFALRQAVPQRAAERHLHLCTKRTQPAFKTAQILDRADVQEFAFTNSIPLSPEVKTDRVRILSAAPLIARAMRNIHLNESVSTLFT